MGAVVANVAFGSGRPWEVQATLTGLLEEREVQGAGSAEFDLRLGESDRI